MANSAPLRAAFGPIYTVETYQAEETFGFLAGRCVNTIADAIDESLAELGVNAQQFGVLHAIHRGKARNPSELARLRFQYSAAITYVLDQLEEKGLLLRKRSAQDRRMVGLELTGEGAALTQRCIPLVVEAQNRVLTSLSHAEYKTLSSLLRRIAGQTAA